MRAGLHFLLRSRMSVALEIRPQRLQPASGLLRAEGEGPRSKCCGSGLMSNGLKAPLPQSSALLCKVQECLGPNRLPLLIAIDGADGVGKSSLASWLGWQLGAPAIHLDLYLVRDSNPLQWKIEELRRIIKTRLVEHAGPLLVEGILILDALSKIERKPDFLVYVDGEGGHSLSARLASYRGQYNPEQRAQFRLQGFVATE
jgi:hypothetical protein